MHFCKSGFYIIDIVTICLQLIICCYVLYLIKIKIILQIKGNYQNTEYFDLLLLIITAIQLIILVITYLIGSSFFLDILLNITRFNQVALISGCLLFQFLIKSHKEALLYFKYCVFFILIFQAVIIILLIYNLIKDFNTRYSNYDYIKNYNFNNNTYIENSSINKNYNNLDIEVKISNSNLYSNNYSNENTNNTYDYSDGDNKRIKFKYGISNYCDNYLAKTVILVSFISSFITGSILFYNIIRSNSYSNKISIICDEYYQMDLLLMKQFRNIYKHQKYYIYILAFCIVSSFIDFFLIFLKNNESVISNKTIENINNLVSYDSNCVIYTNIKTIKTSVICITMFFIHHILPALSILWINSLKVEENLRTAFNEIIY